MFWVALIALCLWATTADAGSAPCRQWPVAGRATGAANLNYNCLRLDPTFRNTSAVDTADTGNQTAVLFIHNTFPTAPAEGTGWNFASIPSTASADYSIDTVNGILNIAPQGGTIYTTTLQFMTCRYSSTTASNYIGTAFGPGYYAEVDDALSKTDADNSASGSLSWDIFWNVGLVMLTGGSGAAYHTAEYDIREQAGASDLAGWGYHDWTGVGVGVTWRDDLGAGFNDFITAGNYARVGISIQPAQYNDGVNGLVKFWKDDTNVGDNLSYNSTGPSTPAFGGGGHNGNFSSLDTQKDCLVAAAGIAQYHKIRSWRVYTR